MKGNPLRLFDLVPGGGVLPLGSVRNRRSMLSVANLAAAILAVLAAPRTCDAFYVKDGRDLSTLDFVQAIGEALGKRPQIVCVPVGLLRLAGYLGDLLPMRVVFPLDSNAVTGLLGSLVVDSSPFEQLTGFVAPQSVEDALASTVEWYTGNIRRPIPIAAR